MTNRVPSKRPDCKKILEMKELWSLNENEFNIEKELNTLLESGCKGKNFLIHSILESKLISLKRKKMAIRESSALDTLRKYEDKPDLIQKFLVHLKNYRINDFELRTNLIDSVVDLMRKYSNLVKILELVLKNAIACLYSLVEYDSIEQSNTKVENSKKEKINTKQLDKIVEVTLTVMELFPHHQELQKSALIILYSEQILEILSTERYKCSKLVMDSMVNFNKTDMNLMASVICSTNLIELSIVERTNLGSNYVYIKTFLDKINCRVESSLNCDLIENTLTALVNFLVDSSKNCLIFLEQGGLDVCFSLLMVR
jgi:Zyg-11 family protein